MGKRQRKKSRKKRQRRSIQYRGFFAYPDANKSQGEISRAAIKRLNCDPNCDVDLLDWKDTTGSRIISNILQAISERHFLVADISGLNPNVLFEVGFACGGKKHLVLVGQGNSTEERQRDLANMHILSGINVFPYQNAEDLATCIIKEAREFHKEPTIDKYIISGTGQVTPKGVLFLKGSTNHEYARAVLDELENRFDTVTIDDWNEDISQPLSWYLSQIEERSAVAACFVDQTWDNAVRVNARFAVICGIAIAMRKPVLMVGLPGYEPHFDYQDLLKIPRKLGYVKQIVNQFADNHDKKAQSTSLYHLAPGLSPANIRKSTKLGEDEKELVLLDLVVGSGFIAEFSNTIAENEEAFLPNYYVETGQFRRLMSTSQALVIDTKGSGKTANLFMLREKLSTDRRNIVRVVKPSDHEMSRFFSGLKNVGDPSGRATHVAENAWKLLLYCEILSSIHGSLVHNRVPASLSDAERDLLDFCESRAELIQASFARRLDIVADWLLETECDSDNFSQLVHQRFMNEASSRLSGSVLRGKTIVILVDNLDKTWGPGPDTQESLIMPLSLLGLQRKIGHELGKNINVNLIAFLRRNMFELILNGAREPDKLLSDAVELVWDEPRTLLKVIDERFKASSATHIGHEVDPWTTFFPPTVEGVPTQQWIMESIVPRPRDLIHLVRRAIEIALNRNHSTIEDTDLVDARRDYSLFALEQIVSEYRVENQLLVPIIHLFADMESEMTVESILKHMKQRRIFDVDSPKGNNTKSDEEILKTILTLVSVGFLGVRLSKGTNVRYASLLKEARVLSNLVKNRSREGRLTLFVNPVFRLGLANSRISDNTAPSSYSDTFSLMRSIRVLAAKLHSRF